MMYVRSTLYLSNIVLRAPHEALFMFLIFILGVQLGASPFQLMIMACIKPVSSIFSFFASALLDNHPQRVRQYLILNILLGCLPCFLFPFIDNVWYYIASYALAMVSTRAAYPAWIEYLKNSDEMQRMSSVVSKGGAIEYGILTVAPTLMAVCIDRDPNLWRWMFLIAACIKLSSIGLILCIKEASPSSRSEKQRFSLSTVFLDPVMKGWDILKEKPGFAHYLIIFFIGGAGIIGTQSILPLYFKQELQLSYTELAMAFSFCKGISFIATSPFWTKLVNKSSLYIVNCLMNLFSSIFFVLLIASSGAVFLIFPAYLFYGTMQAGCKLSWNLSGAVFSDDEDSSFYSSMNLALVGIRGVICPCIGYLLYTISNAYTVFSIAFALCMIAIIYGLWIERASTSSQPQLTTVK